MPQTHFLNLLLKHLERKQVSLPPSQSIHQMLSGHIMSIVVYILLHFGYDLYFLFSLLVYLLSSCPTVMVKSLSKVPVVVDYLSQIFVSGAKG